MRASPKCLSACAPTAAIETPLDLAATRAALEAARADGIDAVAIVFMHAYAFPDHEREAARLAHEAGFTQISVSHEVSPLVKFVGRGDTTVVDAYLSPLLRRYVDRVAQSSRESSINEPPHPGPLPTGEGGQRRCPARPKLLFMQSSGGLTSAHLFRGKDAILSGPAGGVVGAVETARIAGFAKIIGFDMGGTSTDVCHFDGVYERTFESVVAGVRVRAPMMLIHTVAAGGGSILLLRRRALPRRPRFSRRQSRACLLSARRTAHRHRRQCDGREARARVLPQDLRADAGSAARRGGRARSASPRSPREIGDGREAAQVADGFIRIAVENMANAIKTISVQRGYDVTDYVLNTFGGAGGQHACLVADALGIGTRADPSAVGRAVGLRHGACRAEGDAEPRRAAPARRGGSGRRGSLRRAACRGCNRGAAARACARGTHRRAAHLRYLAHHASMRARRHLPAGVLGTDSVGQPYPRSRLAHASPQGRHASLRSFEAMHRQRFGFISPDKPIEIEAIEVEALGGGDHPHEPDLPLSIDELPEPQTTTRLFTGGTWHDAPVFLRAGLEPGHCIAGPALIIEPHQTVVVEPHWQAEVTAKNHLLLTRATKRETRAALGTNVDPVLLEVFNKLFTSIAEQMGYALQNTARSVNIKERLDFSCAIFDGEGRLVANAPHIPVHLGSMDRSVETVRREVGARSRSPATSGC